MKLWLDDTRAAPDGWTWSKTAKDAIKHLKGGSVTHVSLDHDLNMSTLENPGDGYEVACWIEQQAQRGDVSRLWWHVHSRNPEGRKRIQEALRGADVAWWDQEQDAMGSPVIRVAGCIYRRIGAAEEALEEVKSDVDEFLKGLIKSGQDVHEKFEKKRTGAEAELGGDYSDDLMIKQVRQYIKDNSPWGNDEMSSMLARIIVSGDFVY